MFELTTYPRANRYYLTYDPFKEMEAIERRFFGRQAPAFRTDIRERDDAYILECELPGFAKEEISVEIKDGDLVISAEHRTEDGKETEERYLRRERSCGSYTRRFGLDGIDTEAVTASHKDGILTLTLPKLKEETKRIEIK